MADEMAQVKRALRKQRWLLIDTGRQHLKAYPPGVDPETDGLPYVLLPGTIGEGRGFANLIAALRRHGFVWRGR